MGYFFSFHSLDTIFFHMTLLCSFHFVHLFLPHIFTFMQPLSLQGVRICAEIGSYILLVGFVPICLCFHTKLLWYLEAFMACCLKSVELRWGSTKPAITYGGRDQGRNESSLISTIHNPYLKPRWGFTSTSESTCQQPIMASPSDCSLSKQARGTLRPTGIGGFLSLCTQLVVSAINRHLPAITEVVLWAAVLPDVWPRCDYSLC